MTQEQLPEEIIPNNDWKVVYRNTSDPPNLTAEMLDDPVTVFLVKNVLDQLEARDWIFGTEEIGWDNFTRGVLMKDFSAITTQYRESIPKAELTDDLTANRVENIFEHLYGARFKEGAKYPRLFNLRHMRAIPPMV